MKNDDKIKDLFGAKLKSFETDVPDSLWSGIEHALSEKASLPAAKYRLRSVLSVAAGLIGLIIVSGVLFFTSKPDTTGYKLESASRNKLHKNERPAGNMPGNPVRPDTFESVPGSTLAGVTVNDLSEPELLTIGSPNLSLGYIAGSKNISTTVIKLKQTQNRRQYKSQLPSVVLPSRSRTQNENIAMNLRSGSGILGPDGNQKQGVMAFTSKSHPEILSNEPSFRDQIIDLEHNQPISFGLTVSKQITPRVSIETGVLYTYLSSTFKTINGNAIDEKISFHYLGIPLSANYTFASFGKADFYISAGARIEKDVQGRYNGTLINEDAAASSGLDDNISAKTLSNKMSQSRQNALTSDNLTYQSSQVKKNIHQKLLQLSSHLSVGASFPIHGKLYIYGNIGGAYYFDADNEYPTIYSDKKTQLDLNLGLKLKF